jgi:hypothetical protein
MSLRNPETHRLTPEGNSACGETVRKVRKLYKELRKSFTPEEVYYIITTAAHECVMEEALFNKEKT